MTLTLGPILLSAGIDPADAQVIRHAFVREHEDTGLPGIHADSTDDEILAHTRQQSAKPRIFPTEPPRLWVAFIREDGGQGSGRSWITAVKSRATAGSRRSTWSSRRTLPSSGTDS